MRRHLREDQEVLGLEPAIILILRQPQALNDQVFFFRILYSTSRCGENLPCADVRFLCDYLGDYIPV